ncbi:MAG: VWA domain-containing protein, partial [Phycisphaerae bacterium]
VPVLVVVSLRSLAGLDPVRRVLALIARSLLIVLVSVCLAGVQYVRRSEDLTVMFVMDRSHSVQALEAVQEAYLHRVTQDIPRNDRVCMIDFARQAFLQQLPMRGGYLIPSGRLPQMPNTDRTDVAAALRLAMAMFPHDTTKRIVLMSDGNDNMGDVLSEVRRAKADGIPIDVVPLWYRRPNEIYFERMIAPTYAEKGEQVPIRMVVHTDRAASGSIAFYQNGVLVALAPEDARVELKPGSNTFYIKVPVSATGAQRYEAVFRPDNPAMDAIALNNTQTAFSFVSGSSRVLLLTNNPRDDAPLADALRSEHVDVQMRDVASLGQFDRLEMGGYSTIVLANVPAAAFTEQQQADLALYVRDMGGGLVMLGGDESYGAGGWIGSPIESVMPVSFEIKHKRVIPRGALVLIMHSCEMPRGNYWGKEMAKKSVDTVSSQDYLGVLAFTYSPPGVNWEVPLDLCTNKAAVKARIGKMQIGDMPDFAQTMQMGLKALTTGRGRDAAQKHMIIISDGDPQPPSAALLGRYRAAKVTVSTIGIGWGAHVMQQTMRNIASKTGGKFYAPKSARQLPQIFVKESKVVRRPLIVDEPFTPQIVQYDSDLVSGVGVGEALPELGGMILTSPKENPNVQMPIIRATDDGDDPVLAYWQCELGKAVAFTSGLWPRWGQAWTQWPKYAKFWAQLVRWTMRQEAPANFDVRVNIEGNRGRITVDALGEGGVYLNQLQLPTRLITPDGKVMPLEFTQTGPGRSEAEFVAEDAGQYLANIQVVDAAGKSMGTIRTGTSVPYSPEYRDLQTNEALLRQVVEVSGGRWIELDDVAADPEVFSHDLPPAEAKRPAWAWVLAWCVLPLFLLDVAVRRLANWLAFSIAVEVVVLVVLLFGVGMYASPWGVLGAVVLAELVGWGIRFRYIGPLFDFVTHGVTAMAHTGDRSAASLAKLKTRHEQVQETLGPKDAEEVAAAEGSALPEAVRRRRFDVGDEQAAEPAADLHDALGGAKTAAGYTEPRRAPAPGEPADASEQEDATSRLLRAKRRAKRDIQDKGKP